MTAQAVLRVADEVRRMIVSGELLPGHPVRQEHMAGRLGVSRLPVREALRQLAADGLVSHVHNVGYTVTAAEPGGLRPDLHHAPTAGG